MKVHIKKLEPSAVIPTKARTGDAGLDLVATSVTETDMYIEYGTGLAISVPENHGGFILPRSSISKYDLLLCNSVGLIDPNYSGEIKLRFKKTAQETGSFTIGQYELPGHKATVYKIGDRIGQLLILPVPEIEFEEVEELEQTNRGENGFGSSGV